MAKLCWGNKMGEQEYMTAEDRIERLEQQMIKAMTMIGQIAKTLKDTVAAFNKLKAELNKKKDNGRIIVPGIKAFKNL